MRRKHVALVLVSAWGLASTFLILAGADALLWRVTFGIPLVVLLPGYAVLAAVLPKSQLDKAQRLLISCGLSLAVTILGGLILNWTPWGLQSLSWAIWLGGITLTACVIAFLRQTASLPQLALRRPRLSLGQLAGLGLAGLVVLAAAVVTFRAVALASDYAAAYPAIEVVQLWAVPQSSGDQHSLNLGVANFTSAPATYRLRLQQASRVLQEWPAITLLPGQEWGTRLTLPADLSPNLPLDALLYGQNSPIAFRRAQIWLNAGQH